MHADGHGQIYVAHQGLVPEAVFIMLLLCLHGSFSNKVERTEPQHQGIKNPVGE